MSIRLFKRVEICYPNPFISCRVRIRLACRFIFCHVYLEGVIRSILFEVEEGSPETGKGRGEVATNNGGVGLVIQSILILMLCNFKFYLMNLMNFIFIIYHYF